MRIRWRADGLIAAAVVGAVLGVASGRASAAGSGGAEAPPAPIPDDFTIALGGDLIGPYRPVLALNDPGFGQVVALLRSADIAFANQEGSVFDLKTFQGGPSGENGGGHPQQSLAVAAELKSMGIRLMSKANNHATDWGLLGLAETERSLQRLGITAAGSGANPEAARAAGIAQTARGPVALVATASTFMPMSVAQPAIDRRGERTRPSPGISVIRTEPAVNVTREEMAILAAIGEQQKLVAPPKAGAPAVPERLQLGSQAFRIGDTPGATFDANADDETAIIDSITAARRRAPAVVFSIHAHETLMGDADWDDPRPAAFLQPLFHRAIDAGAGVVVRHGPHVLNGIEIYHGRPILYGLGSLFFDFGGKRSYMVPGTSYRLDFTDAWFETAVAVARYRHGQLAELRLYPMLIEVSERPTCGLPRPATGADAQRILERLRHYSQPFGTDLRIEGDVGVVYGPGAAP